MQHKKLSEGGWNDFSLCKQMANIGAEIGRTINRRKKNRPDSEMSLVRGFELLSLTIDDPKNRKSLREIVRVRELLGDYFYFDNVFRSTDKFWNDYFYNFAYAARVNSK